MPLQLLLGDLAEARSISAVFGDKTPWISSTKSMTGHEMWMSGAAQAVYSIIMNQNGFIAPNINCSKQDPDLPNLRIATETMDERPKNILLNSAGFGGTNSCIVLKCTL